MASVDHTEEQNRVVCHELEDNKQVVVDVNGGNKENVAPPSAMCHYTVIEYTCGYKYKNPVINHINCKGTPRFQIRCGNMASSPKILKSESKCSDCLLDFSGNHVTNTPSQLSQLAIDHLVNQQHVRDLAADIESAFLGSGSGGGSVLMDMSDTPPVHGPFTLDMTDTPPIHGRFTIDVTNGRFTARVPNETGTGTDPRTPSSRGGDPARHAKSSFAEKRRKMGEKLKQMKKEQLEKRKEGEGKESEKDKKDKVYNADESEWEDVKGDVGAEDEDEWVLA